jgi:outer membrane protein TolC
MTLASLAPLLVVLGAEPRKIDVEEAIGLALGHSPQVKAVNQRREATVAQADSLRGRMLPLIAMSEEWQRYDSPFSIAFGPSSFVARNIITNTFAASIQQPLLQLFRLYQERASQASSAEGLKEAQRGLEGVVRESMASGYLRYFEAKAAEDIARTSQSQLEDQVGLVAARLKAGTATNADRLRLEVAVSNAKLQRIQAQASESQLRTALLLAMGLEPSSPIELLQPTALETRAGPEVTEAEARDRAAHRRPEVLRALKDEEAARHHATASYFALLPDVALEGAYSNLQGQVFAPQQQYYFGVKATWAVWEWGATFYAARAADKTAEAAALTVDDQTLQVQTDVSNRWVQAGAAASAIEAAQASIASAEEAYRVTQALVSAGSATTTDLLDAQSSLTQAKLNLVRARYEQALALVALERALGG